MKLGEAIEVTDGMIEWEPGYLKENERQALKLLIEAAKRVKKDREGTFTILLPGETEE